MSNKEITWDQLVEIAGEPIEIEDWEDKERFVKLIKERRLVTEHAEGDCYYYKIGWGWVNRLIYWEFPKSIPDEIEDIESEEFDREEFDK